MKNGCRTTIDGLIGPSFILLCTIIWGAAFLAQKLGADHYGPFGITCYRNVLGGLFLFAIAFFRGNPRLGVLELKGGALSGVVLCLAMVAQQIGIEHTTPGISAFLTTNYVLLVPIFVWLVGGGRSRLDIWVCAALALFGTYLICMSDGFLIAQVGCGEAWTLLCSVLFAVQIMAVNRFARNVDVVKFSMVQLFAAALTALPFIFLPSELSRANWHDFVAGLPALLFVGVLSSGIAYTLQNLGQARTPPAIAAVIMSMESVFGAFFGWLILDDVMTSRQLLGCGLVLSAVLLSQFPAFMRYLKSRPKGRVSI